MTIRMPPRKPSVGPDLRSVLRSDLGLRGRTASEQRALKNLRDPLSELRDIRPPPEGVRVLGLPPQPDEPPPLEPPIEQQLGWFEFQFVDEWAVPIPNIEVELRVDGRRRSLRTNGAGLVRVDDVSSTFASARLTQPDLVAEALRRRTGDPTTKRSVKGDDVRRAQLRPTMAPFDLIAERPTTVILFVTAWLGIRLVDAEGRGVPGRAYRVTTASGRVLAGSLDARGEARLDDLDDEPSSVVFPDIDDALLETTR